MGFSLVRRPALSQMADCAPKPIHVVVLEKRSGVGGEGLGCIDHARIVEPQVTGDAAVETVEIGRDDLSNLDSEATCRLDLALALGLGEQNLSEFSLRPTPFREVVLARCGYKQEDQGRQTSDGE